MKNLLSAMHKNPTGTSAGERNHKSGKRVHSRNRARLGASKVEIGIAIVFNAKQLQRRQSVMCNGQFLRWLSKIGTTENDLQAFDEKDEEDEDDEQEGDLEDFLDEFVDVNILVGVKQVQDDMLFNVEEEVIDQGFVECAF
jgi:hypothetical protein